MTSIQASIQASRFRRIIYFHNGSLGDFLMTLHLCENIYAANPKLDIVVLVPRNEVVCRQLVQRYPFVEVIYANKKNIRALISLLRQGNCCITPPTPGRIPLSTKIAAKALSLIKGAMIGFEDSSPFNRFLYTKILPYDIRRLYFETLEDVAKTLNIPITYPTLSFHYTPTPSILTELNLQKNNYLVFHPFGSSSERSFSRSDLKNLVQKLRTAFPTLVIVISGSEKDEERYRGVLTELTEKSSVALMTGVIRAKELATLLSYAKLFIGVDTGVTHLASILGTKSIVIAHKASPPNWLPYYNAKASILYHIQNDPNKIYEGRDYLWTHFYKVRCLEMPPQDFIYGRILEELMSEGKK